MNGSKEYDYLQKICSLEAEIENLQRRNRMLNIELDVRKISKYLTVDEVAESLRANVQAIRNEIKRGKLHTYMIGDRYVIGPEHLKDYLISIEK